MPLMLGRLDVFQHVSNIWPFPCILSQISFNTKSVKCQLWQTTVYIFFIYSLHVNFLQTHLCCLISGSLWIVWCQRCAWTRLQRSSWTCWGKEPGRFFLICYLLFFSCRMCNIGNLELQIPNCLFGTFVLAEWQPLVVQIIWRIWIGNCTS